MGTLSAGRCSPQFAQLLGSRAFDSALLLSGAPSSRLVTTSGSLGIIDADRGPVETRYQSPTSTSMALIFFFATRSFWGCGVERPRDSQKLLDRSSVHVELCFKITQWLTSLLCVLRFCRIVAECVWMRLTREVHNGIKLPNIWVDCPSVRPRTPVGGTKHGGERRTPGRRSHLCWQRDSCGQGPIQRRASDLEDAHHVRRRPTCSPRRFWRRVPRARRRCGGRPCLVGHPVGQFTRK